MNIGIPASFDRKSLLNFPSSPHFLTFLGFSSLFLVLCMKYFTRRKNSNGSFCISSLPGPKAFPLKIIGNSFDFLNLENLLPTFLKWSATYGPCFRVTMSGEDFVCLNSAENVQALFKSSDLNHIIKPDAIYGHLKMFLNNSLLVSEGQLWKTNRKLLTRGHSFNSLKAILPMLHRHSTRIVATLENLAKTQNGKGAPIEEMLSVLFFDVITEMITGADLYNSEEGERCRHWMKKGDEIMIHRITHPWLKINALWWFHPGYKTLQQCKYHLNDFVLKMLEDYRTRNASVNMEDKGFRSMLQDVCDEGWSDEDIIGDVLFMLAAGHETSSNALDRMLFLLALNPKQQALCHEEIDSVLGSCDTTRPITSNDLSNLKYLEWCLLEAMRIFPSVYLFARRLDSPLDLNDMTLPMGTNVLLSPWTQHRLEQYWPEPEKFDPNRFCPEEMAKRPAHAYIPFSGGIRNCLGMKMAMMEIKLNAAQILHKFRFTTETKLSDVVMLPCIIVSPKSPCLFVLHKRHPNVN